MASSFGRSRVGLRDDLDRLQTSYQEFHDDAEDSDEDSAAPPQFQHTSPTYQNKTRMGFGQNDKQLTDSKGFSRPNLFSPNMSPSRPLGEIYGKKNYNGIMHTEDSPEGPPGGPGGSTPHGGFVPGPQYSRMPGAVFDRFHIVL